MKFYPNKSKPHSDRKKVEPCPAGCVKGKKYDKKKRIWRDCVACHGSGIYVKKPG